MKASIIKEEWWPVYMIDPEDIDGEDTIDIPDDLVARYEKIMEDFDVIQTELEKLFNPEGMNNS